MITLQPIAVVRSPRVEVTDDYWGDVVATIELAHNVPAASLDGIEEFSHVEILYLFDRVSLAAIVVDARHPRNNPEWPSVGIFAQRAKARPNRIGSTIVRVLGREGRVLRVQGLDAVDRTPVLDIKPVMVECLPREPVRQPDWSREVMRDYWRFGWERENDG